MIDLLDPELHRSGAILDMFRTMPPVSWCNGRRGPGYWSIVGHPELALAARDATFASFWGTRPEVVRSPDVPRPLHNLDAPEHDALRAIAARAFGASIDATITSVVHDAFASYDGDAVRDLAEPIPARIFATWMGLGESMWRDLFARVMRVHHEGAALIDGSNNADDARAATESLADLMRCSIDRAPHGSVLHAFRDVPREDAIRLAVLFVEAGMPTLTDAISSGIADLLTHDVRIDDIALAIEELLRRASPIAQFARRATKRVVLGDQTIEAGDQIVLWFVAANRDPRVFEDPDAFRPSRSPNPHVAFGMGPHRCLGASLGRRVLRVFFTRFLEQTFEPTGTFERRASSYLRGFVKLPCVSVAHRPSRALRR
jgi:cytochrome P450